MSMMNQCVATSIALAFFDTCPFGDELNEDGIEAFFLHVVLLNEMKNRDAIRACVPRSFVGKDRPKVVDAFRRKGLWG
ncbi:MAG: hypothetical protein B7X31_10070 [Thiomonas sp. 13-66-29]|nr:MAG: hypothetical protein B7X31_10070 [Thiomonas sp. 13-66-29]